MTSHRVSSGKERRGPFSGWRQIQIMSWHWQSLTTEGVEIPGVTSFVCWRYGFKTPNITEARYNIFMCTSGGKGKELLARIKKINCASLPPCTKTLLNHIKRAQYVARTWKADETNPTGEASPTDYG